MNRDAVDGIARTVLYEGYLLYPYRPSALKNQMRWNFGVLYPEQWTAAQTGPDRSEFQMEFLARGDESSRLHVLVRFLHLSSRDISGQRWQEAVERSVEEHDLPLSRVLRNGVARSFCFDAHEAAGGGRHAQVSGEIRIDGAPLRNGVFRISVRLRNATVSHSTSRDDVLLRSLAAAHAVIGIRDGECLSVTDPPAELRADASACRNQGVWPVLVGPEGSHDTILGSPIILSDYPQIAPETTGDLFDGTEMDEMLSLRILTLGDAEKAEIRASDQRAREILDRVDAMQPEELLRLHGVVRELRRSGPQAPWSAWDQTFGGSQLAALQVLGTELRKGDRVRLRPGKRADILDAALDGKIAIIEAIEQDFEDNIHVAVVVEDDPGRDLGELRQAAHRFFFAPTEIEPIDGAAEGGERSCHPS